MKVIYKDSFGKERYTEDITIIKETKKYIYYRENCYGLEYRAEKQTGKIQDGTYHRVITGIRFEI